MTEDNAIIATPALARVAALVPAEMGGEFLYWSLFSSGWDKTPRGRRTYSLTKPNDTMKLLFDDTTVYVVDPQTGYDQSGDQRWRTDIYAATMTPAVQAWIVTQLPDWWDWDFAIKTLHSTASDEQAISHGRAGRFSTREHVCDTEWSMLHMARVWHFPPNAITYEPELRLVWSNRQTSIGGRPVSLWTDGKVVTQQEFYHPDKNHCGEITLTQAASKLISVAVRRRAWRQDNRWKPLMLVASYETETLRNADRGGPGNYDEKRLEQLTTDTGLILYMVSEQGGYLGEDGETWDHYELHEDRATAEKDYQQIEL